MDHTNPAGVTANAMQPKAVIHLPAFVYIPDEALADPDIRIELVKLAASCGLLEPTNDKEYPVENWSLPGHDPADSVLFIKKNTYNQNGNELLAAILRAPRLTSKEADTVHQLLVIAGLDAFDEDHPLYQDTSIRCVIAPSYGGPGEFSFRKFNNGMLDDTNISPLQSLVPLPSMAVLADQRNITGDRKFVICPFRRMTSINLMTPDKLAIFRDPMYRLRMADAARRIGENPLPSVLDILEGRETLALPITRYDWSDGQDENSMSWLQYRNDSLNQLLVQKPKPDADALAQLGNLGKHDYSGHNTLIQHNRAIALAKIHNTSIDTERDRMARERGFLDWTSFIASLDANTADALAFREIWLRPTTPQDGDFGGWKLVPRFNPIADDCMPSDPMMAQRRLEVIALALMWDDGIVNLSPASPRALPASALAAAIMTDERHLAQAEGRRPTLTRAGRLLSDMRTINTGARKTRAIAYDHWRSIIALIAKEREAAGMPTAEFYANLSALDESRITTDIGNTAAAFRRFNNEGMAKASA